MIPLDHSLFDLLNLGASASAASVAWARFAGDDLLTYLLVATVAVACVGRSPWRNAAWQALAAVVIAAVLAHWMKQYFDVPRPFMLGLGAQWLAHSAAPGFPSSHAATAAAWGAVGAMAIPKAGARIFFCAMAGWVGWARIALGLHFPVDVLAGWLLGALSGVAVQQLADRATLWHPHWSALGQRGGWVLSKTQVPRVPADDSGPRGG